MIVLLQNNYTSVYILISEYDFNWVKISADIF